MSDVTKCQSCLGSGEMPTDFGLVDCPDCGGAGSLPTKAVLTEWRTRDIERAIVAGKTPDALDVRWLIAELRLARSALTEVITLADDATDSESMTVRIRFAANRALGLYEVSSDENAH
ncbi:MAG TPA: hypothetical protein VH142_15955 [Polyangiaceae bacterium]|nr:hypothetical protein [Polyangiaceae bacterium]